MSESPGNSGDAQLFGGEARGKADCQGMIDPLLPASMALSKRYTAIVSSRLGRHLLRFPLWLKAVRWSVEQLNPNYDVVVTAQGMMTAELVEYWAVKFGVPLLKLSPNEIRQWSERLKRLPVDSSPPNSESQSAEQRVASADFGPIMMAQRVIALSVRAKGNIENLLHLRLRTFRESACWFLAQDQLTRPLVQRRLLQAGAIGWHLKTSDQPNQRCFTQEVAVQSSTSTLETFRSVTADSMEEVPAPAGALDERFLYHWTREPSLNRDRLQRAGTVLSDWWLRRELPTAGPLATLWQIVTDQRLLASTKSNRAGVPVICFTECTPSHWNALRSFQSHLGRWDFQPYGLAVDRLTLLDRGTRPVIYGNDHTWPELTIADRPFFQKTNDGESTGRSWRYEREWRLVGDLDLKYLRPTELFIFVPTAGEARWLQGWSRWPVISLNE